MGVKACNIPRVFNLQKFRNGVYKSQSHILSFVPPFVSLAFCLIDLNQAIQHNKLHVIADLGVDKFTTIAPSAFKFKFRVLIKL